MPSGWLFLFVILWTSDFAPLKGMFCNTRWLLNVCRCPPCDLRVQATVWLLWTSFWCQTSTRYRRCFYTASIGPVVSCFQRVEEMFSVQNHLCVKKCRVISWHLQDGVGSWAKTKVSICSVDFAQRNLPSFSQTVWKRAHRQRLSSRYCSSYVHNCTNLSFLLSQLVSVLLPITTTFTRSYSSRHNTTGCL